MKYAIKVPFDDTWLYVTHGDSKFQIRPVLYETREEAEEAAKSWKIYEVVEYESKDWQLP